MDLEVFRKNIENKGVKTGNLVFLNDAVIIPIKEHKDLTLLTHVIYEFESKNNQTVEVLVQPSENHFDQLEEKKFFMSENEYAQEKLKLILEKQEFERISLKTNSSHPIYFKIQRT